MKPERVVEPPIPFEGSPCDWIFSSDRSSGRWLKLYRSEVAELGAAAISLAALRHIKYKHEAYFGGQDEWALWAGVDESTIKRHINILVDGGYVERDGRQGPRHRRYKLSRKEPVTHKNEDFAVLPLGFLSRVTTFTQRIVFAITISKCRTAIGIIKKNGSNPFDEEGVFAVFEQTASYLREATEAQVKANDKRLVESHYEDEYCVLHRTNMFRLTSTDVIKWGVSKGAFVDAKSALNLAELIDVHGYEKTFIVPSGRRASFEQVASWF